MQSSQLDFSQTETFRKLAHDGEFERLVLQAIGRIADQPNLVLPNVSNQSMIIQENERFRYSVELVKSLGTETYIESKNLLALAEDVCLVLKGNGSLTIKRYHLPKNYDNRLFDPDLALASVETIRLQPGEAIHSLAGQHILDTVAFEGSLEIHEFVSPKKLDFIWAFDRETMRARQQSFAHKSDSRKAFAMSLLANFVQNPPSEAILGTLTALLKHRNHSLRWDAMKNLLTWDPKSFLSHLQEMALHDPHEHVREAATATYQNLLGT